MSEPISILVAIDDEIDRGLLEVTMTRDRGIRVLDYVELDGPSSSGLGAGDALVVVVANYSNAIAEFVVGAVRHHPARPVVLVCPPGAVGSVSEVFASGVDDIVTLPAHGGVEASISRELTFTIEKALMRRRGVAPVRRESSRNVICVLGMKGGSGKTLTSVNLAVSLALAGRRVAIMDLDLQFGDIALAMGVAPTRTIYDLVRSGGSLDEGKLEDFLVDHPSGVRALLAPVRPDQAAMLTVPFLQDVQQLLGDMFEFVLIDTPASFAPEVISAVDTSDDVLVVAMRDTLALKNTKLGLETLERMEYDRSRVKILLNRANTHVGIEGEDVLAILGRDVDVLIPSHRDVARSMNQGEPVALARSSEASKAFRALADTYISDAEARREQAGRVLEWPSGERELTLAKPDSARARQSLLRRFRAA